MKEYDVIVVGAGPAGAAAAKTAAERGAKTIMLEEHLSIGLPQHCSGRLHGTKSGLSTKILSGMDSRVVLSELKARRFYSPRGRILDVSLEGKGVYLVDRGLFDHELAAQAAKTGADIFLNTKATGLITSGDQVIGVTTNRKSVPEIHGKIVIAADGIQSLSGGIPVKSGLAERQTTIDAGANMLLYNVKDVEKEVIETHVGPFALHGWIWLQRNDISTCHAGFKNIEAFERCRNADAIISKKLKEAVIARITGYGQVLSIFPNPIVKKVKAGLILAGAAANYNSFLLGYISGTNAGQVATDAVKAQDFSEDKLAVYDDICKPLSDPGCLQNGFSFGSFYNLSEDEQEDVFDKMTKSEYVNFDTYDNL